jgi:hypothetical protein
MFLGSDRLFIEEDSFRYNKDLWKTIWPRGLPPFVNSIKWQNKNKVSLQQRVNILPKKSVQFQFPELN